MSDSEQNQEEEKGFTVTDRRFSSKSDEEKERVVSQDQEKPEKEQSLAPPPPRQEEPTEPSQEDKPTSQRQDNETPVEVTFSGLIFSLSHTALIQLGEIPDPASRKKEKNLTLAKQSIDLIALLEEKSKGNLAQEEELLLKNVLYDLRMRFVQNTA